MTQDTISCQSTCDTRGHPLRCV